jgi:hypothetical protein
MNFLARFRSPEPEPEAEQLPPRRRTFSATQYRDEELARAAEARAAQDAADAAAAEAAAEARARRLAETEAERLDEGDGEDAPSAEPPMDWEEAVGWLAIQSADARNVVAAHWNWEHDLRVLQFLVAQPDMDQGVATGIFWLTGATDDFFPWSDETAPADPQFKRAMDMVDALGRRLAAEEFESARFGFDDSWDCSQLRERLEQLYMDGRIEWSPANIPTVSPGSPPTLDDVPAEERSAVRTFLARHGAL